MQLYVLDCGARGALVTVADNIDKAATAMRLNCSPEYNEVGVADVEIRNIQCYDLVPALVVHVLSAALAKHAGVS